MLARLALVSLCASFALIAVAGCDSGTGTDGATSTCDFNYTNHNDTLKDFGESCASNNECAFGVCIMPGASGNIINSQFGFCSRGCNCNNAEGSSLSAEEKASFTCLDPSGFQGKKRQVVPICGAVSDCAAIDAGWTECAYPESGGAVKVCQAL